MVPRIVVVDATPDMARIVRGAMALLSRPYILVEVPTAEAALDEAVSARVDLLLAAYRTPGTMNGVELARRVAQQTPAIPAIVLADAGDPIPAPEDLAATSCQFFMRPVAESFLRGLRAALNGERVTAAEVPALASDGALEPVPPLDAEPLRGIVGGLVRDVGALGAILADRTGRIVVDVGATGALDREKLVALVGPGLARAGMVGPLVGGNAWAMHYYDGERLDIFGLALGVHYFLCLLFEGTNRGALGPVMMYGRRVADQIIQMLGSAAYQARPAEMPSASDVEPGLTRHAPAPSTQTSSMPSVRDEHGADPEVESLEELAAETDELDLDALFGQMVDESLAASAFDPDDLGHLAASLGSDDPNQVDYSDAIDMGILDD
ncbi:MAG: hypothetical protein AB1435_04410 [Chloroflexota bacterium]